MDVNNFITILIGGLIASGPGLLALYLQWKKEKRTAPLQDSNQAVDTSESAARALKSYSDEVIRLREKLNKLEADVEALKTEIAIKDAQISEWQIGIKRLIAQLVSLNVVPVWEPKTVPLKKD